MAETNYFKNHKKNNKILWEFLDLRLLDTNERANGYYDQVTFHENYHFLRWVMQRVMQRKRNGNEIKFIITITADKSRVFIQEWFDLNNPKGYTNIVEVSEDNDLIALYNALVKYIMLDKK